MSKLVSLRILCTSLKLMHHFLCRVFRGPACSQCSMLKPCRGNRMKPSVRQESASHLPSHSSKRLLRYSVTLCSVNWRQTLVKICRSPVGQFVLKPWSRASAIRCLWLLGETARLFAGLVDGQRCSPVYNCATYISRPYLDSRFMTHPLCSCQLLDFAGSTTRSPMQSALKSWKLFSSSKIIRTSYVLPVCTRPVSRT